MQETQNNTAGTTQSSADVYEHFILYLYLWAAYADYEIRELGKDMIREKMEGAGLVSPVEFETHWHKAWQDFISHNDYEGEEYIKKTCEALNLDYEARQRIFNDLKEIMEVEGIEDGPEKMNLFKFKKMLGV